MLDIIVRGGIVVDGTGRKRFRSDLGIAERRVVELGKVEGSADVEIDASGMVVCPGFIDLHSHTDFTVLVDGRAESMVRQGVTTAVVANCGHAVYPVVDERKKDLEQLIFGYVPTTEITWHDLQGYCRSLAEKGVAMNIVSLVGLGTVRLAVLGFERREPSDTELSRMRRYVENGMKQGAFGVSTGLEYPPGSYASNEEVVELCRVASKFHGFYATHARNRAEGFLDSAREAIAVSAEAGLPLHLSHFVPRYPSENAGQQGLALIEAARKRGLDVTCDTFPVVALPPDDQFAWGSTTLTALLPSWAFEKGQSELRRMLADKQERKRLMKSDRPQAKLAVDGRWNRIMLESASRSPQLVGKTFDRISHELGVDPWDAVFDILLKESSPHTAAMASAGYAMDSGRRVMKHPTSSIISDGLALSPEGPLAEIRFQVLQSYGYIPLLFERFVRKERLLTLESAVSKCTYLPAKRLGLKDRGLVDIGCAADITIFDPDRIECMATFEEPRAFPLGIEYVMVNGELVVERGRQTTRLPGGPILRS